MSEIRSGASTPDNEQTDADRFIEIDRGATVWRFEREFLESNWTCIYGSGCQGILPVPAEELNQGCCSLGAHFGEGPAGQDEAMQVSAYAAMLTPEQFQHHDIARDYSVAADGSASDERRDRIAQRINRHSEVRLSTRQPQDEAMSR